MKDFLLKNKLIILIRELQTAGISTLPMYAENHGASASFALIASSEIFLIWHNRDEGVYLVRDGALLRLQPTPSPTKLWACDRYVQEGDFYCFRPKEGDLVIFLNPEFLSRFKTQQLEESFSENIQLHSKMKKLTELGETYGYNLEQSWFALQVQRAEGNSIYQRSLDLPSFDRQATAPIRTLQFLEDFIESKVTRVMNNPYIIPLPLLTPRTKPKLEKYPLPTEAELKLASINRKQLGHVSIQLIDEDRQQARLRNLRAYEAQGKKSDPFVDKMREFTFEPLKAKFFEQAKSFFLKWPQKPVTSFVFASGLILMCFLLLLLFIQGMKNRGQEKEEIVLERESFVTEETVQGIVASAPLETNLEIAHIVEVNSLQIRHSASNEAPLLMTVKRGDSLTQLAEVEDGWIYVRAEDGVEGYVLEKYLFAER